MRATAFLTCFVLLFLVGCGDKGGSEAAKSGGGAEKAAPAGGGTPAPATAPAPAPAAAVAGAGIYGVDMDAMKAVLDVYAEEELADQKGDDAELFASIKQGFVEQYLTGLQEIKDLRLELKGDGTMTGLDKPGGAAKMKGTWKQEGTVLTFTTTEEEGQLKDPPVVMTGTLENGQIRIRFDESQPFDFVLRKM